MKSTLMLAVLLFIGIAPRANGSVIYSVNRTIGTGGVTGILETDGTIGVLTAANFVDWNLFLDNGVSTFNLLGPLSGSNSLIDLIGTPLSATPTEITFNFGGSTGYLFFGESSSLDAFWSLEDQRSLPGPVGLAGTESVFVSGAIQTAFNKNVPESIASSAVPEPASLAVVGFGALGLVVSLRRRRKA